MIAVLIITSLFLAAAPAQLPVLVLPSGDGGWVVRIETSGGLTGRGAGHFTVSSSGDMMCVTTAACPARVARAAQASLSQLVAAVPREAIAALPSPVYASTCNDCVITTMTIVWREQERERTVMLRWDASTAVRVPDEMLRLHAAVVALAETAVR